MVNVKKLKPLTPLAVGTQLAGGRFVLDEAVGHGGMGLVYRGRDLQDGSTVAIKVAYERADAAALLRMRREAALLGRLSHANVVGLKASGLHEDTYPFFVMPYLDGETIWSRVDAAGAMPAATLVPLFVDLAEALAYIHSRGVVHRDIKPENILLVEQADGSIVPTLADFGLAKAMGGAAAGLTVHNLTKPGSIFGTVGFMSPEQIRGEPLTPVSDVFSLAATLRFALTGEQMFPGESAKGQMTSILEKDPLSVVERLGAGRISELLDETISRALARDPAQRMSAREFMMCLAAVREGPEAAEQALRSIPPAAAEGWFWGAPADAPALPIAMNGDAHRSRLHLSSFAWAMILVSAATSSAITYVAFRK